MPRSAIAAGGIDFVLTPEDIASELKRLGQHPYVVKAALPGDAPAGASDDAREQASFARVLTLLHETGGTDFSAYKKTTLRRRIARRMVVSRVATLEEYALHLAGNPTEAKALYEDCLISVTSFFRDAEVFDSLSEKILPQLLKNRPADAPLRVWGARLRDRRRSLFARHLPAGATGDLARQSYAANLRHRSQRERAGQGARGQLLGEYRARRLAGAAASLLQQGGRHLSHQQGHPRDVRVRPSRPDARPALLAPRSDQLSQRAHLPEPPLQELVFATFHYALRPDGFLLVGSAETVGASSTLFAPVDEKRRLYSRKTVTGPPRLLAVRSHANPSRLAPQQLELTRKPIASEVPREADRMLLARFGPAAVVVDEGLRVLEFRGDTEPFLDHGRGKATLSLERLVRKGLTMELRQAIAEARRSEAPVRKTGLHVRHKQHLQSVSIEVLPIRGRAAAERCLLVLFETEGAPVVTEAPTTALSQKKGDSRDLEIERLGQGLAQSTEYVHTLVREHESALEELQSTTEEALSSNEELQSLNEELQTAKEEIQSANEELSTLNQELQDRNAELGRSKRRDPARPGERQ